MSGCLLCDKCNNYFSRKVEGPLLNSDLFILQRGSQAVPNKRGRVPKIPPRYSPMRALPLLVEAITRNLPHHAASGDDGIVVRGGDACWTWMLPIEHPPSETMLARFVGKVGLEALAKRALDASLLLDEVVNHPVLDPLREFVRFNRVSEPWPIHERKLYSANMAFSSDGESYQVLHEYTLLYTDAQELYVVVAIFGVEFTMNLAGPTIDGYLAWLEAHDNGSPLYPEGLP